MNFIEIASAQVLVQMIFVIIQTTLVMVVMFVIFDNPFVGDVFPAFFLLTLIGAGGMCFGKYYPIPFVEFAFHCYREMANNVAKMTALTISRSNKNNNNSFLRRRMHFM